MATAVEAEEVRFASDSPLEGDGFEPSVPRRGIEEVRSEAEEWVSLGKRNHGDSCSAPGPSG